MVNEGVIIPHEILRNAKISGTIDVKIREKEVIIKERNITRSISGYCGNR